MRPPLLALLAAALCAPPGTLAFYADYILPPKDATAAEGQAAFIMAQGAEVDPAAYAPLAHAIQDAAAAAGRQLWVGVPQSPLNTPQPLTLAGDLKRVLNNLTQSGLPKEAPVFYGGHSLGGAMVQQVVAGGKAPFDKAAGQMLYGAALLRKYDSNKTGPLAYPIPTLQLAGELDGLCRSFRLAESYHRSTTLHKESAALFPVVIVPGMTHWQFASGPPPALVKAMDIKPEISDEAAFAAIAAVTVDWMERRAPTQRGLRLDAGARLRAATDTTAAFVKPIVAALQLEGFAHFKPPCNDRADKAKDTTCPFYPAYPGKEPGVPCEGDACNTDPCYCGCPWTQTVSQQLMAGALPDHVVLDVLDAFHPVAQVTPIHLPHIWSDCAAADDDGGNSDCVVNLTTVSENTYELLDPLDTGFQPISAHEIRTKLKSRQTVLKAATGEDQDFNQTDMSSSICRDINQKSLDWARDNAAAASRARFESVGQAMVVGEDKGPYNTGPLWIWHNLEYHNDKDNDRIVVQSPFMATPDDYWEPMARGFHYCKVLSPARALEWMYVDGLRKHGGIHN